MDVFIGFIASFGFNYAPRNWSTCQGQLFNISDNSALFALVQTFYGGDGRITGGIPEMRGRTAIGYGNAPGLGPYSMGQKSGYPTNLVRTENIPAHSHLAAVKGGGAAAAAEMQVSTVPGTKDLPAAGDYLAAGTQGGTKNSPIYIPEADKGATVKLGGVTGGGGGGAITVTNGETGGSQPISIMQPYQTVNYCMALLGLFPSRN